MNHNRIPRILALLLAIAMIVLCILLATPVRAAECRLVGKPEPEEWEPDEGVKNTFTTQCGGGRAWSEE